MIFRPRLCRVVVAISIAVLTFLSVESGLAQVASGPLVIIHGHPDATSHPPTVESYVSVIGQDQGRFIEGLTADRFQVYEAGAQIVAPQVEAETVGLAAVVVIDRGGIAAPRGAPGVMSGSRIRDAVELTRNLLNGLHVAGTPGDDVVALVCIGEGGALTPTVDFTYNPVDVNLVLNALVPLEAEPVRGPTPLYEGIDEALRLMIEHPLAETRQVLAHRRKVIVVLSDGIDREYSDTTHEDDIIRKALESDVAIYTIGIGSPGRAAVLDSASLERVAYQTYGINLPHDSEETHLQVLDLFEAIGTQRQQYIVRYTTRQRRGDYTLRIVAMADIGSGEDSAHFSSILEPPAIALASPSPGFQITVPYSHQMSAFVPTVVTLSIQVKPVDGIGRNPAEVRYFANELFIGAATAAPSFELMWDVAAVVTPTEQTQSKAYTLRAEADDTYLSETVRSAPVNGQVTWGAIERTTWELVLRWLTANWWLLIILGALLLGLIVLWILLRRTQSDLAKKVVRGATSVLRGITRPLSSITGHARGRLVIVQGANIGKEFKLTEPVTMVGRDPQFCDFALYDEFVSNPHFSVRLEANNYVLIDENSTNGTTVNGWQAPTGQRLLLQPDAIIEVGQTRLQFKRIGGTTRVLKQTP